MNVTIEKATGTGFCFGVKRAIATLEKVASERGSIETLGAVVHNKQVLQQLKKAGVLTRESIDKVKSKAIAIGAHGVSPATEQEIRSKGIDIIDTTCRFVKHAQLTAKRFAETGFFTVVYGDVNHPEVMGIMAWVEGKGLATLDADDIAQLNPVPQHIGVLAQTTQIPANFNLFIKDLVDKVFIKNSELDVVDTICHDIRRRQHSAEKLAQRVDLMFVVGDRTSANTTRLGELCSRFTQTHLIETASDIKTSWLKGHRHIGVTGGASTSEETINDVIKHLEGLARCEG